MDPRRPRITRRLPCFFVRYPTLFYGIPLPIRAVTLLSGTDYRVAFGNLASTGSSPRQGKRARMNEVGDPTELRICSIAAFETVLGLRSQINL
jgi:hypothetical protein